MIKSRLQAITLILLIFLSPFYFSDFVPNVNANPDWLTGWQYRKSHVINPASGAGTNYQVRITVYYGSGTDSGENVYLNGKCRSDFGDIRFTDDDGITLLDYWMESKVDSNYAIFWVEVADDLSTNSATIYIYYGKSDATTTSSLSNTFVRIIPDLKLALPFDEGTGSVVYDKSGNNLNGTIYNAAWTTGKYGYALDFNGVDSYVEVPHSSLLEYLNYTLVCWIKADTLTGKWRGIVTKNRELGGTSNAIYGFWTRYITNYLHFRSGGTANVLNVPYSDTVNLHMLSMRVTSGKISYCYIDKTEVGTFTDNRVQGSYPLQIGRANFIGTTEYFDGKIDEVRYFGRTLTESEIQDLYDYYPFEVPTNSESVGKTILRKYVSPEPSHGSWGSEETLIIERFAYQTLNIQTSPFRQSSYSRTASQTIQILTYASRYQGLSRLASQLVNFVADATRQLSYERTSATQLLILTQTLRQTSYTRTANQLLNIIIASSRQTSYSRTANQLLNIIIASSRQTSHNRLINIPLNIIAEATRLRTSVRSVDQQVIILMSISRNATLNRFASQKLTFLTELWLTKALRRFASQVLTILTEATRHQAFHRLVNQPLEILLSASRKAFYHRTAEVLLKIHTATSIKFILYIEVPIPTPTPTPAPALPSIQLDAIIQTAHIARLWWKPTSTIEVLVINKGIVATDVTFEYVMLDINNQTVARGQQTVFISGLDKKTITINILTPPDGTYTVHFQTTAPVKVEAKTVTLTVETPFYGKLSFTILLIMLAVLIIYLASRRKRR